MSFLNKTNLKVDKRIKTETFLLGILVLLFFLLGISSPAFLTSNNIFNLLRQTSINGVVAIGMVFVIISAGIDLSVGSVVGLSGVAVGMLLKTGMPILPASIISIIIGTLVGLLNGVLVNDGQVPPFIATLGSMTVIRGLIMLVSGARMVSGLPKSFTEIAQIKVIGIPFLFIAWVVVIIIAIFITKKLIFGRNIYALGSNKEAARLSGIDLRLTTYGIYMFSAFAAAIAGILMTSRLGNGIPTGGAGYELDAIAAAVVGGASLDGGEGTVIGTVLGAMIMSTLRNGGNLLGVNPFILEMLIGSLIVIAVLMDKMRKK